MHLTNPKNQNEIKDPNEAGYYLNGISCNDALVIKEIYELYSEKVIQIVVTNSGNVEAAKDVFQDVIMSLYVQTKSKKFELTCSFSHFFLLACKRRWLNVLNSKYRTLTKTIEDIDHDAIITTNVHVNQFFEDRERMEFVSKKMKMLDPSCLEIIECSWEQDEEGKYQNWQNIALKLGFTYGYARKKAAECKQRLIELIKKDPAYQQYI
jgi:RNA polymerase sigma factor (sigma-70 family)